jgi:CRP-like cAMP-binding protein
MVRNLGFFSAHRSPGEAAVMLGLTLRELCGRPIADDVMEFLAQHLLSARQAALRRGFAGVSAVLN